MGRDMRAQLNEIYRPLHEAGKAALKIIRGLGYEARMVYCNLHETLVDGAYQTEYFPLPEIEIEGVAASADLGVGLDLSAWLELTLPREKALLLDYADLAARFPIEVYGAEDYLSDFYRAGMDSGAVPALIRRSAEREIHVCFRFARVGEETIRAAFGYIKERL